MSPMELVFILMVVALLVRGRRYRRWARRLLDRVDRMEQRVDRLAMGDRPRQDDYRRADELHRLEERVHFLERLLEERQRRRSLPRDDGE